MSKIRLETIKWSKDINRDILEERHEEIGIQYMCTILSNPVLRDEGEKLLMNIDNELVEFFKESIETFGLEDVLVIREREAYNVDGDKIEDMSAVVITDISRESEIDGTKIYRLADALQKERMKKIIEEIKTVVSNYTFRFNENNQEICNERVNSFIREISNERVRRDRERGMREYVRRHNDRIGISVSTNYHSHSSRDRDE